MVETILVTKLASKFINKIYGLRIVRLSYVNHKVIEKWSIKYKLPAKM